MAKAMKQPRPSILVVDNDAELRALLAEYLEARDYEVFTASNGLEALWVMKQRTPRTILLDLRLPRLGGLDTIKHIRNFDPSIRIIVVTGDMALNEAAKLRELGIPIVLKPINFEALAELLESSPGE